MQRFHLLRWLTPLAFLAVPTLLCAQDEAAKKYGKIFKSEVDGLISQLRESSADDGSFGDGSCLQTAQVLTAMGYCHRFYGLNDGPVVRKAVLALFSDRRADGAFVDEGGDAVETSAWVATALEAMDPDTYAADVAQIRTWIEAQGAGLTGPDLWLGEVRDAVAAGQTPVEVGQGYQARMQDEPLPALLGLVACQVVARELDGGEVIDGGVAGFSATQQRGFDFLLAQQQGGIFLVQTPGGPVPEPGMTAMGLAALQSKPRKLRSDDEHAVIDAGIEFLIGIQNEDGSFGQRNANYTTCAVILALAKADRPELKSAIERAQRYVKGIQNVEGRGYAKGDRDYGSIGYGGDQRGDMSNTQFAIEALRASGLDPSDEAFVKAIVFLQRTQNLQAVNDYEEKVRAEDGSWQEVTSGDDGGSAYYPGNSPAGYVELPDGRKVPRSYGSMTYALLKTYTLAGVGGDDPRVSAAVNWIEDNWTLDENPGADPELPKDDKLRYQGHYYYFMVLAQALDSAGIDALALPADDGETIDLDWRELLHAKLNKLQSEDGSWVNERNDRWWEGQPTLCTIYAMLALERCAR